MKTISRYIMTLALLITAATGAWAEDYTTVFELNGSTANVGKLTLGTSVETGSVKIHVNTDEIAGIQINADYNYEEGKYFTIAPETGSFKKGDKLSIAVCFSNSYDKSVKAVIYADDHGTLLYTTANGINGLTTKDDPVVEEYVLTQDASVLYIGGNSNDYTFVTTLKVERPASAEPAIEVTTDAASEQDVFTTASFTMPAFDATAEYELVRDLMDHESENDVHFSGLPSSGNIVVKKGSDGKYQPAEALTIQLIDPLADNADIITADGITIKVLVGNGGTPIEYDQLNPITLEAFLADMKPGYYWIKAESTDENSPYDGTVYSSEFTVVEKYDLTVKPANDFSKGKLDEVTVDGTAATPDAEGKVKGIAPNTEVKLKAKRGYVIEKVEAWNSALTYPIALSAVTADYVGSVVCSDGNVYPAKTAAPSGKTAVGILGKVTDTGHGLILALKNANSQNWNTINGWTGTTDFAGTTLKVLPGGARGANLTSYTTLGETAVSNWAVAQKSDYEAIFVNLGSTTGNENGTTYDAKVNAYITGAGGTAISDRCWSATGYDDSDAWDFLYDYWRIGGKTRSRSVRPVLGF